MKLSRNTILITGGASGIGLELALQLQARDNTVIVTGRNQAKLDRLAQQHPLLHTIQSNVNQLEAIQSLYTEATHRFPKLNILINNAGIMRKINLHTAASGENDLGREIETNLLGPIRMVQQFLPHLRAQSTAAIVNVSSGLAFTPFPISPIYGASKVGLHSFTQSLRVQLRNTHIKVFELAPPSTDTALNGAFTPADLKGAPMMDVHAVARQTLAGLARDRLEILPGFSKVLRLGSRVTPNLLLKAASASVDSMLADPIL